MKRQRWVDPMNRKRNRFRRLCALCGLTMREAADWLEITEKSVAHRMAGTLGISEEEERRLLGLWKEIRSPTTLDPSYPASAVQQQMAYREAAALLIGDEVDPDSVSWTIWEDSWSEAADAELRADERPAKPLTLYQRKPPSST